MSETMVTALVIVGALVLASGLFLVARSRSTRKWPSTHGKILASRIHWAAGAHEAYRGELRYRYSVHGKQLEGVRVSLSDKPWLLGNKAEAEWLVAQYPVGKRVAVFYDPLDPCRTVLKHRLSMVGVALVLAGAVFLAATLAAALSA